MSKDKQVQHPHDYDGIVELDNDLPRWWLGIFWVTAIFAAGYVVYYHWLHPENLPIESYRAAMEIVVADRAAATKDRVPVANQAAQLDALYLVGGWETAKADFTTFCVACHAADGGGGIGPNFTDDYYLHGGKLSDFVRVITEGVPEKGMVSWRPVLKPDQIANLACLIKSLRGTTPAAPKPPEGRQVDADGNFVE